MAPKVKGVIWLSSSSPDFDAMCRFYADVFGLTKVMEYPGFAAFRLPNSDTVEVFAQEYEGRSEFTTGPVAGFEVEDVPAMRVEMERAGIEFIGPVHTASDGGQWAHFRAPDGNIYEITMRGSQ